MKNILIIDDSPVLRTKVREFIETLDHHVVEACNGLDGLEKVRSKDHQFDLILCDVNMPEMDGIEFCKSFQEDKSIKDIPIFLLTTEANPDLKKQARAYGVRIWITKPFSPDLLRQAMEHIFSSQAA